MLKARAKAFLQKWFPRRYTEFMSRRSRRHSQKLERAWGCIDVAQKLVERQGTAVSGGPFEGLEFPPRTLERHIAPKLIGSYEKELHSAIRNVSKKSYSQIIDVGCAEGYYAVGFALLFPKTPVIAFDTDPWARDATQEMARLNGVDNISLRSFCDVQWLSDHLTPGALVFSDCEGFEDDLLKPAELPPLRFCDVIVEVHQEKAPGVARRIAERFRDTHDITDIQGEERNPSDYDRISFLPKDEQQIAINEYRRSSPKWFFMQSRAEKTRHSCKILVTDKK
jgi:hypothetical protein